MYFIKNLFHKFNLNQLILIYLIIFTEINQSNQTVNDIESFQPIQKQVTKRKNDVSIKQSLLNNETVSARSDEDSSLQLDSSEVKDKLSYLSRLGDLNNNFNPQKASLLEQNSISAPDFQANSAGFILPEYLTNSAANSVSNPSGSSTNNLLNKLSLYDNNLNLNSQPNIASNNEEFGYIGDKNSFMPSNLRERRKNSFNSADSSNSAGNLNNFTPFEHIIKEQNLFDQTLSKHLFKNNNPLQKQFPQRDNEFASNSLLETVSSPLDNQEFNFNNLNTFSNDFSGTSDINQLNGYSNLPGFRGLGLANNYNNLNSFSGSSSSLTNPLSSSSLASSSSLNSLSSVVPPGAIVGAPGSSPPPGMKLAGYVTVTNPSPSISNSISSTGNLLSSPTAQQQLLLNQVMNRNPQAQALAQIMAQSMSQSIRIPFNNPYANNFQNLLNSNNFNGFNGLINPANIPNVNQFGQNNLNTNNNKNVASSQSEQQTSSSSSRAKFLQRLNPLNLFRKLRTRNQKNLKNTNKDQNVNNVNTNNINNNINNNDLGNNDLEERSQLFFNPDLLLGSNTPLNPQSKSLLPINREHQLAQQLASQLAQLNLQLAQQSTNKPKFIRKLGLSLPTEAHKLNKRDTLQQINVSSSDPIDNMTTSNDFYSNSFREAYLITNSSSTNNSSLTNDTEVAENGFFPVADFYHSHKFFLRPRFRFPAVREQRRISNTHGLHINSNNFLTSSSNKNNFVGIMGSGNFEVIRGGMFTPESTSSAEQGHNLAHTGHTNGQHKNHNLPHHHNQGRNLQHIIPNKSNKFNLDNDFNDDDDEEDDSVNNFNGPLMNSNSNSNLNSNSNQRNSMFLDDEIFSGNLQNNGKNLNSLNNGGILGFQGFNSFSSNTFNTLSSATNINNLHLNKSPQSLQSNSSTSKDNQKEDFLSLSNANLTTTSESSVSDVFSK